MIFLGFFTILNAFVLSELSALYVSKRNYSLATWFGLSSMISAVMGLLIVVADILFIGLRLLH